MLDRNPDPQLRAEIGSILAVNTDDFSCMVRSNTGRVYERVQWLSPWAHPDGQGVYAMPQPHTRVLLMWVLGGDIPYIMGWLVPPDETGGFRNGREELRQGDVTMGTPDGAHVTLRNGGLVEIYSSPLNHWLYIPLNNITRGVTENYELITTGGRLDWTHDRETRRTTMKWLFRDTAVDQQYKLQLEAGYIEDGSLMRVVYSDPDAQDGGGGLAQVRIGDLGDGHVMDVNVDNQVDLSLGRDENTGTLARVNVAGDDDESITVELGKNTDSGALVDVTAADGDRTMQSRFGNVDGFDGGKDIFQALLNGDALQLGVQEDGSTKLHIAGGKMRLGIGSDGKISFKVNDKATLEISPDGTLSMELETDLDIDAGGHVHVTSGDIKLGSASSAEPLVLGTAFMTLFNALITIFNAHMHVGNVGAPTGPPLTPATAMSAAQLSGKAKTEI